MKWVIECRINSANNLGNPSFEKKKKARGRKRERKKRGETERKSQLPSGGKSCY